MKLTPQTVAKFSRCLTYHRGKRPLEVQIELTNRCNFDCAMCPRSHLQTPIKDMSDATFEKIFHSIRGVKEIILTGWGEPLIHPKFFEFASRIKTEAPGTIVRFTTNGCMLNEERVAGIIETGIDAVAVSMDSLNETETSPGHPSPKKVADNVANLIRKRGNNAKPVVTIQTTLQKGSEKNIEELIRFAGKVKADNINLIRLMTQYDPNLVRPDQNEERMLIRNLKKSAQQVGVSLISVNDPGMAFRLMNHNDRLCIKSVYHAYVTVEGNVTPCCSMRNHVVGNALVDNIETIWNSEPYRKFFAQQETICADCDQMKRRQTEPRNHK